AAAVGRPLLAEDAGDGAVGEEGEEFAVAVFTEAVKLGGGRAAGVKLEFLDRTDSVGEGHVEKPADAGRAAAEIAEDVVSCKFENVGAAIDEAADDGLAVGVGVFGDGGDRSAGRSTDRAF